VHIHIASISYKFSIVMSYKFVILLRQRLNDVEVHLNCEMNIKLTAVKQMHIMWKFMSKCSETDEQLN
jgi:sensor domain CHASE-containing protein